MNYIKQAINFLDETNTLMTIEPIDTVDGFPFDEDDTYPHNHYKVTLIGGGYQPRGTEYSFDYYGSYNDYLNNREPNEYDILASLIKYDVGDMADFVDEFCYHINDRKSFKHVEKIWQSCKEQYQSLLYMFGPEGMEKLMEIN